MRIGVPKEIKNHEYRVGLTPQSVAELVHHGHDVLVERDAGVGSGLTGFDSTRAAPSAMRWYAARGCRSRQCPLSVLRRDGVRSR